MFGSIATYNDPEQAKAAYHAARTDITLLGREPFTTRATHVKMNNLWATLSDESTALLKHKAYTPDRAFITFLSEPSSAIVCDGIAMAMDSVIRHSRAHSYFERSYGESHRAGISIPVEEMALASIALVGDDITCPTDTLSVAPPPPMMARLRNLHAITMKLARDAICTPVHPDTAHALEQSLMECLIACVRVDAPAKRSSLQHGEIAMRRFHRVLDENPDKPIYLPKICAAIRVPARTLRHYCQDHLGISPHQYLELRRLHMARQRLSAENSNRTTVTEVATELGFWHFGRFASKYARVFGELPSQTLYRQSR